LAHGIVFAPCPNGQATCQSSEGGTATGVGLAFGEFFAASKSQGGWVSDDDAAARRTNLDLIKGVINAVAVGTGGAFAVGQDTTPDGFNQAVVLQLDSSGQTYDPVSKTYLPPVKGNTSIANGISKNSVWIAGSAPNAVYAHTGDAAWTDLSGLIPKTIDGNKVLGSEALIANDDGIVAGTVTTKQDLPGLGLVGAKVDLGFVYDINANSISFYGTAGANVHPLKVLAGTTPKVIGNLEFLKAAGTPKKYSPVVHPYLLNGTTLTDAMTTWATGIFQFQFGCQVSIPNNLGEVCGTCLPDQFAPYDNASVGVPFYLNMLAGSPSFLHLGDAIHASQDAGLPNFQQYRLGVATSIDDQGEVTLTGATLINGKAIPAAFLANKSAYIPGP
jgi:hypothetical protein